VCFLEYVHICITFYILVVSLCFSFLSFQSSLPRRLIKLVKCICAVSSKPKGSTPLGRRRRNLAHIYSMARGDTMSRKQNFEFRPLH